MNSTAKKPQKLTLPLNKLRLDGATQPRAELDDEVRREYRDLYKAGKEMPPVVVFKDRAGNLWLADGFHRHWGAVDANLDKIKCLVYDGELEDARWFSYAANQGHGLRRSNQDKQKAVKAALLHPKGAKMSDRQIAEYVGVDDKTVGKYRRNLTAELPQSTTRTGRDGRTIDTTNIGKKSARGAQQRLAVTAERMEADRLPPPVEVQDVEQDDADDPVEANALIEAHRQPWDRWGDWRVVLGNVATCCKMVTPGVVADCLEALAADIRTRTRPAHTRRNRRE